MTPCAPRMAPCALHLHMASCAPHTAPCASHSHMAPCAPHSHMAPCVSHHTHTSMYTGHGTEREGELRAELLRRRVDYLAGGAGDAWLDDPILEETIGELSAFANACMSHGLDRY
eukprot:1002195-Prymnesium_polylepis.1